MYKKVGRPIKFNTVKIGGKTEEEIREQVRKQFQDQSDAINP